MGTVILYHHHTHNFTQFMQLVTVVSGARSTRHHHHNDQHHHHQVLALVSFPCLFSFNPIEPLTRGMFFRVHGVVGEVQHQHHHRPENGRSSCALGVQIIAACLTRVCKAQTAAHTDKKKKKKKGAAESQSTSTAWYDLELSSPSGPAL